MKLGFHWSLLYSYSVSAFKISFLNALLRWTSILLHSMQEWLSAKILHPNTQNWIRKQEVRGQEVKEPIASVNDAEPHSIHASFLLFFCLPSSSQNPGISQEPPFTVKLLLWTTINTLLFKRTVITLIDDLKWPQNFFKEQEITDY